MIWRRYSNRIKVLYVTRISPTVRCPSLVHVRSKPRRIIARPRFVHRQTISVLLHQSGQPTHPRSCLPLLPSPQDGILKRNKFAFQPTSLVLGRTAASVHLRPRKSCREKPRRSLPSRRRKSCGRRDTAKLFGRWSGQSRLPRSLKSAHDGRMSSKNRIVVTQKF